MYWIITGIILVVIGIVSTVISCIRLEIGEIFDAISAISFAISFFVLLFSIVGTLSNNQSFNTFVQQKAYIENRINDNEIEDYALTTKKVELNGLLFDGQYSISKYGKWSCYPKEVMELQPIN